MPDWGDRPDGNSVKRAAGGSRVPERLKAAVPSQCVLENEQQYLAAAELEGTYGNCAWLD